MGHGAKSAAVRSLAALRLAMGGTQAQAAADSGAAESTVQKWACDPAFVSEVDRLRNEIVGRAAGLMAEGLVEAGEKLREHVRSADLRISLRAAIAVHELALGLKAAADDGRRLDELERRLLGKEQGHGEGD